MLVSIFVRAKAGIPDSELEVFKDMLSDEDRVKLTTQGKHFQVNLNVSDQAEAQRMAKEICDVLLENPWYEEAKFEVHAPRLVSSQGRVYEEIMPGVEIHRRDLEDPNDCEI